MSKNSNLNWTWLRLASRYIELKQSKILSKRGYCYRHKLVENRNGLSHKIRSSIDLSFGRLLSLGRQTDSMSTERRAEIRGSRMSCDTVVLRTDQKSKKRARMVIWKETQRYAPKRLQFRAHTELWSGNQHLWRYGRRGTWGDIRIPHLYIQRYDGWIPDWRTKPFHLWLDEHEQADAS